LELVEWPIKDYSPIRRRIMIPLRILRNALVLTALVLFVLAFVPASASADKASPKLPPSPAPGAPGGKPPASAPGSSATSFGVEEVTKPKATDPLVHPGGVQKGSGGQLPAMSPEALKVPAGAEGMLKIDALSSASGKEGESLPMEEIIPASPESAQPPSPDKEGLVVIAESGEESQSSKKGNGETSFKVEKGK
jgi:hypothetical protein